MFDHSGRHFQRTLALAIQHVLPALDKPNQATLEALAAENDAQAMRLAKTVGGGERNFRVIKSSYRNFYL